MDTRPIDYTKLRKRQVVELCEKFRLELALARGRILGMEAAIQDASVRVLGPDDVLGGDEDGATGFANAAARDLALAGAYDATDDEEPSATAEPRGIYIRDGEHTEISFSERWNQVHGSGFNPFKE